ncbi:MAG TPA: pirin family protein, partial [Stenomitos sp.]
SYEQTHFAAEQKRDRLRLIGSQEGREGSVTIHQDVNLYAATLTPGATVEHSLDKGRIAWLQVARGEVQLNEYALNAGDGVGINQTNGLRLKGLGSTPAEVLLFDMGG